MTSTVEMRAWECAAEREQDAPTVIAVAKPRKLPLQHLPVCLLMSTIKSNEGNKENGQTLAASEALQLVWAIWARIKKYILN